MRGIWPFCFGVLPFLLVSSCDSESELNSAKRFIEIPSSYSGVNFSNDLIETEQFNIIEYLYYYNGGGIAIGDINNDSLPDLYFSSNQGQNRLYLNKGNFKFQDISSLAGVFGLGNWKTGVTMADVNGDGFLDIFSCGVGGYKGFTGRNQLLINNGDLTFSDQTEEYGLDFQGFSTQSVFFDYDNDGDLDMYLVNHSVHSVRSYGDVKLRNQSDPNAGDKLYRNDIIPDGQHGFTEVTSQAGIYSSQIGYGLAVGVADLNYDGYQDIYVSNDFHENDYLYINQRNGTFIQQAEKSLTHTSRFSMGNDIADVNNDGAFDIITLDMLPKEESIIKTTAGEDPYDIFSFKLRFGYHYQVSRNCLQINLGTTPGGHLKFRDIAQFSGIDATDWSWSPLFADFDNDGSKDLLVTNGIVRRPNDLDYINFISSDSAQRFMTDGEMIESMPFGKVSNFIFQNTDGYSFKDVTGNWVAFSPGYSTGAAYADLDNDGDLDIVLNNINAKASILKNNTVESRWLKISLIGNKYNTYSIGARVTLYADTTMYTQQVMSTRGWQSSSDLTLHFGLGNHESIDSLVVEWPTSSRLVLRNIRANRHLMLKHDNTSYFSPITAISDSPLLVSESDGIMTHEENDFSPFTTERLIPHSMASEGPALAIEDFNQDGLFDVFIGGGKGSFSGFYSQSMSGFRQIDIQGLLESEADITDAVFGDVNNDKHLDLILVKGGHEVEMDSSLVPSLYLGDGMGGFKKSHGGMLGKIMLNASCIRPFDFDADGDLDLFIGGRVVTGSYGINPQSYLLSNSGDGAFEITELLPANSPGMVTDALWQDLNSDGLQDIILVGEWMPITVWIQTVDGFRDHTNKYELSLTSGWWNTIMSYDLDQDGDLDWLVGNQGLNSRLKASLAEPVELWVGDIDLNGSVDPIITYYNKHSRYPFITKDMLIKQVPSLKRKFLKYDDFRDVRIEDILTDTRQDKLIRKHVNLFSSVWVENIEGKLKVHNLPKDAQLFPIFSFDVEDIDMDGLPEILAVGNWYDKQPDIGRQDSGYGLIMKSVAKGKFIALTPVRSGFWVEGESRFVKILNEENKKWILVGMNNGEVKIFRVL